MVSSRHSIACTVLLAALLTVGCGDDDRGAAPQPADPTPTATETATATEIPTATATATQTLTLTPTRTATAIRTPTIPIPANSPIITFFGVTRADDRLIDPAGEENGIPVFLRTETISGASSGFSIVVEASRGMSTLPIGSSAYDPTLAGFPDLQIQVDRPLGNGSAAVCDDPMDMPGGVPAIVPESFEETTENISTVNDFACRFVNGQGEPTVRTSTSDSCVTFESGSFAFVHPQTNAQFCGAINVPLAFPIGDTVVSARVRDGDGNVSDIERIIIRVVPLP